MSRKDMEASCLYSFVVNCMAGPIELCASGTHLSYFVSKSSVFQLQTAKRRIETSRGGPNTMQISQVGHPEDTKSTRTEEEQEEQRKKHQNTEKMSHCGTLYQRTM